MEDLPKSAQEAWAAYEAMALSKHSHFELLQKLEGRAEQGAARTPAEEAELKRLLGEHDRQVKQFQEAVRELMVEDPPAHQALVERLRLDNQALGGYSAKH